MWPILPPCAVNLPFYNFTPPSLGILLIRLVHFVPRLLFVPPPVPPFLHLQCHKNSYVNSFFFRCLFLLVCTQLERLQSHLHVINVLNMFQILYMFHPLGGKCCRPVTVSQVGPWWLTNPNPHWSPHSDFRMCCANWRHLFSWSVIV